MLSKKERLLKTLNKMEVDRPPVICPGGMMNAAVTEVVKDIYMNHNSHLEAMILGAKKVEELTGFENYGVPFCMTIECEPFGVEVDLGNKLVEPRVTKYNDNVLDSIKNLYPFHSRRGEVVIEAIARLKNDNIPVIGNITGPMSVITSIMEPMDFYKLLRKDQKKALSSLNYITDYLIKFAADMIEAGADVITMSDPSATGEVLGRKNFELFMLPLYEKITSSIHKRNSKFILHICGNTNNILESLVELPVDALSFDSIVSISNAKKVLPQPIVGNVSTQVLHQGSEKTVLSHTKNSIIRGASIISPACGLAMETPISNLKAMTNLVKESKDE